LRRSYPQQYKGNARTSATHKPKWAAQAPDVLHKCRESQGFDESSAAKNAALAADLDNIVAAWPPLPEQIKRAVLALIG
jgi:hypothetical protein